MNRKVEQTVWERHLFSPGDHLVIAVSGGADSMALLHILCSLREEWNLTLTACHLNHALRLEESKRDEETVRQYCAKLQVPLFVLQKDIALFSQEQKCSLEEAGRIARYRFFETIRAQVGAQWIATAHTRSDSIETTLLHLVRGSSLLGLCGIPIKRGRILRPLLQCSRVEVEAYCARETIPFVQDSSNFENQYSRNKIRNLVLPVLKEINPSLEDVIAREQISFREDETYLQETAQEKKNQLVNQEEVQAQALLSLGPAIGKRLISLWGKDHGLLLDSRKLCFLWELLSDSKGRLQINERYAFEKREEVLCLVERPLPPLPYFSHPAQIGKFEVYPGRRVEMSVLLRKDWENLKKIHQSPFTNALDYDKISKNAQFRQKKDGDRFHPMPQGMERAIKKVWNAQKVPVWKRSRLLILEDDEGIVWAENIGVDRRVRIEETTEKIVWIETTEVPTT